MLPESYCHSWQNRLNATRVRTRKMSKSEQTPNRKRLRPLIARIVLLTISSLFAWFAFETAIVYFDPTIKSFYEYDEDLGFRVRAYERNSNIFGFNDRDYTLQKDPADYRILVVGDSFGWAGGREGNYTTILEQRFERHYGDNRVEVINSGYPSTHTAEQLDMLKKYAIQYQPDMVVLGFFAGNDILDADPYRKRIILAGLYIDIDKRFEFTFLGKPIIPGTLTLAFAKKSAILTREKINHWIEQSNPAKLPDWQLSEHVFLHIENKRLQVFSRRKHANREFDQRIEFILGAINRMNGLVKNKGCEFTVTIFPDQFQLDETLLANLIDKYELDRDDYDLQLLQNLLCEHLRENKISYIDLLDEFRERSKVKKLYLFRNTHLNEDGNQAAADILFRNLLPKAEDFFERVKY